MDIKIQNKIARYIQLSKMFTKTESELFGVVDASWGTLTLQGNGYMISGQDPLNWNIDFHVEGREVYIGTDNILRAKDNKPLSRAQEILLEAEVKAKLANEYDEYKALQKDLGEYFKITNKLTQ